MVIWTVMNRKKSVMKNDEKTSDACRLFLLLCVDWDRGPGGVSF